MEQSLMGMHGRGGGPQQGNTHMQQQQQQLQGASALDPLDDLRLAGKSRKEKLLAIQEMLLMVRYLLLRLMPPITNLPVLAILENLV